MSITPQDFPCKVAFVHFEVNIDKKAVRGPNDSYWDVNIWVSIMLKTSEFSNFTFSNFLSFLKLGHTQRALRLGHSNDD